MTRAELEQQLVDLRRKADKRRDEPGFAANVRALDARIAEIEALLAVTEPEPVEPQPPAEPPTEPESEPEPIPDDGGDPEGVPVPVVDEG